jgi:hypothetical protein
MKLSPIALCFCALTAHAEIIEIRWDADKHFQTKPTLAAGKYVEVCGAVAKDAVVGWRFKSDAPLEFNIHHHVGKDVIYLNKTAATQALSGEMSAPIANDYCWMWQNKGAKPAAIELEAKQLQTTASK